MLTRTLTAFGDIHVQVAVPVADAYDPVARVEHVDADVVVVHTAGVRIDAGEAVLTSGIVVGTRVRGGFASARAAITPIVGTLSDVVAMVAVAVTWETEPTRKHK